MGCEIENVTIHYCDIVCGCYIIYLGKLHYLIIIHRMYSNVGNMLSKGWWIHACNRRSLVVRNLSAVSHYKCALTLFPY